MFHVTFTGLVRAQPELRPQQQGQPELVKMQIIVRTRAAEGQRYAVADVTTSRFTREAARRLHRGSRVLVTGSGFPSMPRNIDEQPVGTIVVVAEHWEELGRTPDRTGATTVPAGDDGSRASARPARAAGQTAAGKARPPAGGVPGRGSARTTRRRG